MAREWSTGIREKDGEPLNLLLTLQPDYRATSMPTAEVIKSQLAEVGIDVTIYGTEQSSGMRITWRANLI